MLYIYISDIEKTNWSLLMQTILSFTEHILNDELPRGQSSKRINKL